MLEKIIGTICPYGCGFAHMPVPASQLIIDIIGYTWLLMALTYVSFLIKRIFFGKEELFEPFFRRWRVSKVNARLPKNRGSIVDVGCGDMSFLHDVGFRKKMGIDDYLPTVYNEDAFRGLQKVRENSVDCVTFIASLEHLPNMKQVIQRSYSVLRPGGRIIITLPTTRSEIPLKIMSKLKLVSHEMIKQHHYYPKGEILSTLKGCGFSGIKYSLFELGFNSVIMADKRH